MSWEFFFFFLQISQEGFDPVDSFETVVGRLIRLSKN